MAAAEVKNYEAQGKGDKEIISDVGTCLLYTSGKLLIVVDEVVLSRREDSERLKNLSTALSYKVEAKGKDRDEIAFFAISSRSLPLASTL